MLTSCGDAFASCHRCGSGACHAIFALREATVRVTPVTPSRCALVQLVSGHKTDFRNLRIGLLGCPSAARRQEGSA